MNPSLSLAIAFSCDPLAVEPVQLQQLFNAGSFWAQNRPVHKLEQMLNASDAVVCAHMDEQLVGFARATSDGIFRATIWDVVVHPDFQSQGIGARLVHTLLDQPMLREVERVYLMTTFGEGFYEKLGFQRNHSTTMLLRRD